MKNIIDIYIYWRWKNSLIFLSVGGEKHLWGLYLSEMKLKILPCNCGDRSIKAFFILQQRKCSLSRGLWHNGLWHNVVMVVFFSNLNIYIFCSVFSLNQHIYIIFLSVIFLTADINLIKCKFLTTTQDTYLESPTITQKKIISSPLVKLGPHVLHQAKTPSFINSLLRNQIYHHILYFWLFV